MQDAFESWIGQEVVVQLGFGQIKVSLHGVLLRDLRETLLMKPEAGPDIEFAKAKVLAIEEVNRGTDSLPSYAFPESPIENPVNQEIHPTSNLRMCGGR